MSVLRYLLIYMIHIISATQFEPHLDLQKVGEIIFNNEKYNVLKPTIHKITDYFEEFMLRRENQRPNERVFIDDNGFRHFWSGFEEKDKNLRKTEIYTINIRKERDKQKKREENTMKNQNKKFVSETGNDAGNKVGQENMKSVDANNVKKGDTKADVDPNLALRQAGQNMVKASFFCPFFGVITMTSNLD